MKGFLWINIVLITVRSNLYSIFIIIYLSLDILGVRDTLNTC